MNSSQYAASQPSLEEPPSELDVDRLFALVGPAASNLTSNDGRQRLSGHTKNIRWLATHLAHTARWRIAGSAVLQVTGTVVFVATSAMVLLFARSIGTPKSATMWIVPLGHARDWSGRIVFLIAFLSSVAVAAAAHLAGERMASSIATAYGARLRGRLVDTLAATTPERRGEVLNVTPTSKRSSSPVLHRMMIAEIRDIEVAARHLILIASPAALFIVSATILLVTSAVLAAMLLPIGLAFLVMLRRQTRMVRSVTTQLQATDARFKSDLKIDHRVMPLRGWAETAQQAVAGDRLAHRRLLAPVGTRSIAHVAAGIAVATLVIGGVSIGLSISVIVPSILAVRFLMQSVESMSSRVVGIARRSDSIESHLATREALLLAGTDGAQRRQGEPEREVAEVVAPAPAPVPEPMFRFAIGTHRDGERLDVAPSGKILALCTGSPRSAARLDSILTAIDCTGGLADSDDAPATFLSRIHSGAANDGLKQRAAGCRGTVHVVVKADPWATVETNADGLTLAIASWSYRWTRESLARLDTAFDGVILVGPERVVALGDVAWFRANHASLRRPPAKVPS